MSDLEKYLAERLAATVAEQARALATELLAVELERADWRRKGAISMDEAATVLGISVGTVKYLLAERRLEERQTRDGGRRTITVVSLRRYLGE